MFARTWLGRCYWLQGRLELARAELERAAKGGRIRGHKIWHTCHQLALVYQSLNMEGKASEWFASALKHQSTAVPLTMLRGFEVLPHVL
jgi:Tfp pilus assembly protein PilF